MPAVAVARIVCVGGTFTVAPLAINTPGVAVVDGPITTLIAAPGTRLVTLTTCILVSAGGDPGIFTTAIVGAMTFVITLVNVLTALRFIGTPAASAIARND